MGKGQPLYFVVVLFFLCYNLRRSLIDILNTGDVMIAEIKDILSIIISLATIATLLYTLYKFTRKPHDTLEEKHEELVKRVDKHDAKIEDIEESLLKGNDKFREQEETNATFKSVMLSFINFEIAYCIHTGYEHTEDLLIAKKELETYLSGKKHYEKD